MSLFNFQRWLGLAILLSVLVLNEWVLGPLFADDGAVDGIRLLVLRVLDVAAIIVGSVLLLSKQTIGALYKDSVVVIFNSLLLLFIANLLVWAAQKDKGSEIFIGGSEMAYKNPELLSRVFNDEPIAKVIERQTTPGASAHPALQMMMRPAKGEFYNSGPEGTRRSCNQTQLEPKIADPSVSAQSHTEQARSNRSYLNNAIWMFGGSTTYGSGVADCETIASYLNEFDTDNRYINFGVESRGQNPEIDHLMLLLRKGYQPKAVLFFDGLNDLDINVLQQPLFSTFEAPAIPQQPYYFALQNDGAAYWGNLITRMPLLTLVSSSFKPTTISDLPICESGDAIYQPNSDFHSNPAAHYSRMLSLWTGLRYFNANEVTDELRRTCADRIKTLYRGNSRFLANIANAFDFNVHILFQPLAVLADDNAFVRDPERFKRSAQHALLSHLVEQVRNEISEGNLPGFFDLSGFGMDCSDCWIDPNHYSPAFNRKLALEILKGIRN